MKIEELPTNDSLDSWDWKEIFSKNEVSSAEIGGLTPYTPDLEDVVQVIAFDAEVAGGVCHELDFVALLQLTDQRLALVEAWTDCTGWGCRDGVRWLVGTPEQVRVWVTDKQRERLGLSA